MGLPVASMALYGTDGNRFRPAVVYLGSVFVFEAGSPAQSGFEFMIFLLSFHFMLLRQVSFNALVMPEGASF